MAKSRVVKVPQIPGPRVQLCYAQDFTTMSPHCDRAKGHGGMHTWELFAKYQRLTEAARALIAAIEERGVSSLYPADDALARTLAEQQPVAATPAPETKGEA